MEKVDARTFAGATPEQAAASVIDAGPLQRTLAGADEATRTKVREAVIARLAKEMQPEGIYLTSAAWLVRAGERAQHAYAWLSAAERYEAALALLEGQPARAAERGWLLFRLARMRRRPSERYRWRWLTSSCTLSRAG